MPRLADIENLAGGVDHAVNAGSGRRRFGEAEDDRSAGLGLACARKALLSGAGLVL